MNTNKRAILTATILCGMAVSALARDIRVELDGSGDYTSVRDAYASAHTGDVVFVGPGKYSGFTILNMANPPALIKGSGPQNTIFTNGFVIADSFGLNLQSASIINEDVNSVSGSQNYGIVMNGSSSLKICNVIIAYWNCGGITYSDRQYSYLKIENCTIAYNGIRSPGHGVSLYYPRYLEIWGSIVAFNGGYALWAEFYNGSENNLFNGNYNCLYGNGGLTYVGYVSRYDKDMPGKFPDSFSQDPKFVNADARDFALSFSSLCRTNGVPGPNYINPDGSRNDMGAYSGPNAVNYWPYPKGAPVVVNPTLDSNIIPLGGKLKLRATVRIQQ
jgi:hypothetical protein